MDRAAGTLFGLAYGDALGRTTEFLTVADIVQRYGPGGPRELTGDPALVTTPNGVGRRLGAARADRPELLQRRLRDRYGVVGQSDNDRRRHTAYRPARL